MLNKLITYTSIFFAILTFSTTSAFSGSDEWKAKMIADALTAAPPIAVSYTHLTLPTNREV